MMGYGGQRSREKNRSRIAFDSGCGKPEARQIYSRYLEMNLKALSGRSD